MVINIVIIFLNFDFANRIFLPCRASELLKDRIFFQGQDFLFFPSENSVSGIGPIPSMHQAEHFC